MMTIHVCNYADVSNKCTLKDKLIESCSLDSVFQRNGLKKYILFSPHFLSLICVFDFLDLNFNLALEMLKFHNNL